MSYSPTVEDGNQLSAIRLTDCRISA